MPLPTAVPPCGISKNLSSITPSILRDAFNWLDQALSSSEKSTGIASIRCVLPVFAMPETDSAFLSISFINLSKAG